MLSPVAVSWMIGKSLMEYRFGPAATLARHLGWENPAFFSTPALARASIMAMDGWVSIPFMMILLLAGLQALPSEVKEAAKVDGASGWQSFKEITFPLMLPVSLTVVILRVIFELKLADIVINVTAGGRAAPPIRSRASSSANTGIARMSATVRCSRNSTSSSSSSSSR